MAFLFNPLHYPFHRGLRWDFAERFAFAAADPFVPLARSEVRRIGQMSLVVIAAVGRNFQPVVPLAFTVGGEPTPLDEDFRWRLGHAPAILRYHPFRTVPDSHTGEPVLAAAVDSETVSPSKSFPFFLESGDLAPQVRTVFRRLQFLNVEYRQMIAAAAALHSARLLIPVSTSPASGRAPKFFTIDREAFAQLPGDQLPLLGAVPRHSFMLAAVLLYSAKRFLDVPADHAGAPALETGARGEAADDHVEFVFDFDR